MKTKFDSFDNWDMSKPYYHIDRFIPFIDWFNLTYGKRMKKEGWVISYSQAITIPNLYDIEYRNRKGDFWQVQRNDEDEILKDDMEAEKLAKKAGLLFDDYGIVIGYNDVSFITHPEELEYYKNINKYNL